MTNDTNTPETLSNVGYYLSDTLIPLDNLNFGSEPPPGSPGSPFSSLPQYDGSLLSAGDGNGTAGGSVTTEGLVPEPSGLVSLATGLILAAGYLRHRHSKAVRRRAAAGGR